MRQLAVVVVLMLLAAGGCRGSQPSGAPPATPAPPPPAALPEAIQWVRDAAEYRAAVVQTYRAASARLDEVSRGRQPGTWAVVLDADETVLSNVQYQIERARAGLPFTAESWKAWVARRAAPPLPGAAKFLARVRDLGGRIAIVTNRLQSECADTEAVFVAHALQYDTMLCRPDGAPSDKNPRFRAVAAGSPPLGGSRLDIVLVLGDNILDFPGLSQQSVRADPSVLERFGETYFLLPNPMYGSWQ